MVVDVKIDVLEDFDLLTGKSLLKLWIRVMLFTDLSHIYNDLAYSILIFPDGEIIEKIWFKTAILDLIDIPEMPGP